MDTPHNSSVPSTIVAQLGGGYCTALGLTGTGRAPCLALCRRLIEHGIPSDTPMTVYRGDVVALRIRTVGEGAQLTVVERDRGNGPEFERWRPLPSFAVAAHIAKSEPDTPSGPPKPETSPATEGTYAEAAE